MPTPNLFGRIGRWADVKARMKEAQANGATVTRDKDAATVIAEWNGETLFRALGKGDGVWLVLYNPNFYPKNP